MKNSEVIQPEQWGVNAHIGTETMIKTTVIGGGSSGVKPYDWYRPII